MQLDADYLALVSQSLGHSAKAVQVVGTQHPQEIADDPMLSGRTLPSRLQVLAERLADQGITATAGLSTGRMRSTIPKKGPPAFFGMANALLRNPKQGRNPRQTALFGIRRRTVQYVVVVLNEVRTVPRRRARWATCNGPSVSRN